MKEKQFYPPAGKKPVLPLRLEKTNNGHVKAPLAVPDGQLKSRAALTAAVAWARLATKDPRLHALYTSFAKDGQSVYHLAVSDYFKAPDITGIMLDAYGGRVADPITVTALDNVCIESVTVGIFLPGGQLLEQGQAFTEDDQDTWIYLAAKPNTQLQGTSIVVTAKDLPGNTSLKQLLLS